MKPTAEQIQQEITALEACKAYIPPRTMFGDDNIRQVDLQIEFLRVQIDMTADEWHEYSESEQSAILEAEAWKEGQSDQKSLAAGWDDFKPKAKAKGKRK